VTRKSGVNFLTTTVLWEGIVEIDKTGLFSTRFDGELLPPGSRFLHRLRENIEPRDQQRVGSEI
jgi:hypothetical protein